MSSKKRLGPLTAAIKDVLGEAVEVGGSTLKDFAAADGALGYFQHRFRVYDREDEPCPTPGCKGVIAREVTLLPSHWDWLNAQPGGASVALRKLVDAARRASGDRDRVSAAQESTYRFISAIAGNLPGFEEASRALFAYDRRRFSDLVAAWPEDVRDYAIKLAFADQDPSTGG